MRYVDLQKADALAQKADRHARRCTRCFHPIIDDEGNPGLFGEACSAGLGLLIAYCDALGEPVPPVYRTRT